jgi:hypothetical protein
LGALARVTFVAWRRRRRAGDLAELDRWLAARA